MSAAIDLPTPAEEATRDSFIAVVKQGQAVFLEVGNALLQLKERRLYRFTHGTFEEFCKAEFGFTRRWAYMLCSSAEVVEAIKESAEKMGTMVPIPDSERQARPLTKLPKAEQSQAWADAVASAPDGKPTAKQVERAVQERISTTKPTHKQYRCPNCNHDEQTEDGDCARCKEPPKRRGFDELAAGERLFDVLDAERRRWPAVKRVEFYEALRTYVEQREAA